MKSLIGGKTLKRKKYHVPWKGWKNYLQITLKELKCTKNAVKNVFRKKI